jgi:hypothetical protein
MWVILCLNGLKKESSMKLFPTELEVKIIEELKNGSEVVYLPIQTADPKVFDFLSKFEMLKTLFA